MFYISCDRTDDPRGSLVRFGKRIHNVDRYPPSIVKVSDASGHWRNTCEAKFKSEKVNTPLRGGPGATSQTTCSLGMNSSGVQVIRGYSSGPILAIKFPSDTYAYAIQGISCDNCVYLSSVDTLVAVQSNSNGSSGRLAFYENFTKRLQLVDSAVPQDRHYLVIAEPDQLVSDFYGSPGYIGYMKHIQKSDNDKWLALEFVGRGIFRLEVETMQLLKFSDWETDYWYAGPRIEYDISDDGRHIAVMGRNTVDTIFEITSGCGNAIQENATVDDIAKTQQTPCPRMGIDVLYSLHDSSDFIPRLNDTFQPNFSSDSGEFTFYATSYENIPAQRIVLRAANYSPPPPLDYLALGDSYSSGEGDTEKNPATDSKYYRQHTDIGESVANGTPREKCHLSTRSYPFLLAESMNIADDKWNTVACSGAKIYDANDVNNERYEGQFSGRDQDDPYYGRLYGYNVDNLQAIALNEFIPGRVKQIEFVEKYKPKVITLTMGGNDIGFGEKIAACVISFGTCDFATTKKSTMASEITKQYDNLKKLYEELYAASDLSAKIYVLGYPNFVNGEENAKCDPNVGLLNDDERELIRNSISYFNNVIEQAAKAAGVKYLEIEDSLDGHRLCDDGEKYVTGISDPLNWSDNRQESFHPNANGHQEIALSVWDNVWNEESGSGKSLIDYDICPDIEKNLCPDESATKDTIVTPGYFDGVAHSRNIEHKQMTSSEQKINSSMDIVLKLYTFLPGSVVNLVIHSNPIDMGDYAVANDGSIHIRITTPASLNAGFHTIILKGKSYSAEPIEYEQTILVNGPSVNDVDDDGTIDSEDSCLFTPESGLDHDQDGIDDGCDSEISEPPVDPSPVPTPEQTPSPIPEPQTADPTISIQLIIQAIHNTMITIVNFILSILRLL